MSSISTFDHSQISQGEQQILQQKAATKLKKRYLAALILLFVSAVTLFVVFGKPFSSDKPAQPLQNSEAFNRIYKDKVWDKSGSHPSGGGSVPQKNIDYLLMVQHLVDNPNIKKIVEVGFGDWQLTGKIIFANDKRYVGYDVVQSLRRKNQQNKQFHLIKDVYQLNQTGDLLITKDVIQHWPNRQVKYFLDKIMPNFKYVLLTNDYTNLTRPQINYGGWSPINLEQYGPKKLLFTSFYGEMEKHTYIFPNLP